MTARRFFSPLFASLLLALASGGRAQGEAGARPEATLFAPVPLAPTPLSAGALLVSEESARRALALGFAATAAAEAERLVAELEPGDPARDAAVRLLTAARLELGDLAGAERALGNHSTARPPTYRLRAGLIAARQGDTAAAQAQLVGLRPELLPDEERAWYYLLQGMVAEAAKDTARAAAAYDQAQLVATSEWQRARLRLTRERLRLAEGEATQEQADELRRQSERYAGRSVGTDYAVQHAVALGLLGRRDAATEFLQGHLTSLAEMGSSTSRDDVRLMLGLLAGPGSNAGRTALEQLLAAGTDPMKQRMALNLLTEGAGTSEARDRLRRLLGELLGRSPAHVLAEELLLARAELALAERDHAAAEADARDLLARFPNSTQKARALTQLASVAWELERFRTAADYAAQAAGAARDAATASALRLLSAEASYRAEDYTTAAEAYAAVVAAPPPGVPPADVMFQAVMAEIGAGRLGKAAELIDRLGADPRFDATTRWQAEWNLARALQAERQGELALARVARLRAEEGAAERPVALRARLAWLEARLAQETGRSEDALRLARAVPEQLAGLDAGLAREVAGLARLVAAEALFGLDRVEDAVAELQKLRSDLSGSEAALESFIVEADIRATEGGLVESQRLLTQFADDNRDHPYAPHAIYQAALNAERRGEDAYYRDAYKLLEERLIQQYKDSPLIFDARMKQGDLLRRLGEFAAAQQIYELLVNEFSQQPRILEAQMALADSHRAQASRDASHFESAITLLERLRDLANAPLDLRMEAGFKLGDMLAQRDAEEALAAWGPVADALVVKRERAAELGAHGRYWAGRMLVRMAGVLEEMGRADEAKDVWRLLVDRGLPGIALARSRLGLAVAATASGAAGGGAGGAAASASVGGGSGATPVPAVAPASVPVPAAASGGGVAGGGGAASPASGAKSATPAAGGARRP